MTDEPVPQPFQCRLQVRWFDVDMTCRCLLDHGHDGDHTDGVRWFNDLGFQVPTEHAGTGVDERGRCTKERSA